MKIKTLLIGILMICLVFAIGCSKDEDTTTTEVTAATATTKPAITTDTAPNVCDDSSQCEISGCSGQLCVRKRDDHVSGGVFTTCEFKEEYRCYPITNCECIDNMCQWEQTPEFEQCLAEATNT